MSPQHESLGLRRLAALVVTFVFLQFSAIDTTGAQPAAAADADKDAALLAQRLALGQRIYRDGLRASGEPLTAVGAAQTRIAGKDAACTTCHRRSGYGASEGKFVVRPITGPALLQEQTLVVHAPRVKALLGTSQRPPYNEALLARALRTGVDAANKPLDSLMPRYAFTDEEMKALALYLFSLSAKPSPGVDDKEIHFATVIQPGVAPERRRAMLDVMQAFVKDKDANSRSLDQRREAGNMRMYRSWRKWVLHTWELSGPSESWGAQLDDFYRQQPVFALVGGLGPSSWQPIHEFAERHEIPSVFPQTDLPALATGNLYNFYLSRGLVLDAEVLARFLVEQGEPGPALQVYRRTDPGAVAAAALRSAVQANARVALEDQVLAGPADEAFWQRLAGRKPGALVLWLGSQDLEAAQSLGGPGLPPVYLSFKLMAGKKPESAIGTGDNIRMVYPTDLPPRHEARVLRDQIWLHNKGLAVSDPALQFNTLFAMTVVSDVIGHLEDSFSRDLFVERVEHVVGQTPMASFFPQVSLGPGQRFAAKGSSIVQLREGGEKGKPKLLVPWMVP